MANRSDITPELCRQLLRYEPETGKLFWLVREKASPGWNAKWADKEAFTCPDRDGYRKGTIYGYYFVAHRVIWAIVHGEWPKLIDHIDGNPGNNRIDNLRGANSEINSKNKRMSRRNSSGFNGVRWDSRIGKWQARIGRNKHIGMYDTKAEAAAARAAWNAANGYTERHGE